MFIVSWRTANPLQDSLTQPPNILSVPPSFRAHRQYITGSSSRYRLLTTVPDRSGARVLFSWVAPDDHRVSLWHGISSVRCKTMFLLLVMVAQSHPATMTDTPVLGLTLLVAVPRPGARVAIALLLSQGKGSLYFTLPSPVKE